MLHSRVTHVQPHHLQDMQALLFSNNHSKSFWKDNESVLCFWKTTSRWKICANKSIYTKNRGVHRLPPIWKAWFWACFGNCGYCFALFAIRIVHALLYIFFSHWIRQTTPLLITCYSCERNGLCHLCNNGYFRYLNT